MAFPQPFQKTYEACIDLSDIRTCRAILPLEFKCGFTDRIRKHSAGMVFKLSGAVVQDQDRMFRGSLRLTGIKHFISAFGIF